jgi:hypothetical protein
MAIDYLSQNPFAVLSIVAAPAILTNASSVLALSTSNRFLRAGERIRALAAELQTVALGAEKDLLLVHVNRVEKQALLLLTALRGAYVALGAFAGASLISIVGAGLASMNFLVVSHVTVVLGIVVGFVGAGGLIAACLNLFRATRLSMLNISEEAAWIRQRESQPATYGR